MKQKNWLGLIEFRRHLEFYNLRIPSATPLLNLRLERWHGWTLSFLSIYLFDDMLYSLSLFLSIYLSKLFSLSESDILNYIFSSKLKSFLTTKLKRSFKRSIKMRICRDEENDIFLLQNFDCNRLEGERKRKNVKVKFNYSQMLS